MGLTGSLAIFFIIWWVVLFAVLPWGVRSHHEAGVDDAFADAGAPLQPRLLLKLVVTTGITSVIFALVYVARTYELVTLDTIPFLRDY